MQRTILLSIRWLKINRPSCTITLLMTFFIICYVLIVKLDSSMRIEVPEKTEVTLRPLYPKIERTNVNVIPESIMKDFADDNAEEQAKQSGKTSYDYYDDVSNVSIVENSREFTTRIYIETQNEREIKEQLENEENVIDDNWQTYLNKSDSVSKDIKKLSKDFHAQTGKESKSKLYKGHSGKGSKISKNLPNFVNIYDPFKESAKERNSISSNHCLLLKTMHGTSPICIHDPEFDEIISAKILNTGTWEPNYLYTVGSVLKLNPDIEFLDLGCNIGVYTILAAQLGHKVVALDPNRVNLRLLTKSLSLGGLRNKVTLVWNAISDVRENITLTDIIGNIGATFVESGTANDADAEHRSFSVLLDDLLPLFREKKVFIKMDVETFELRALQGGGNFFKEVDVQYILMEWLYHKHHETGKEIIKLMNNYGFLPHVNAHHNTKLQADNYHAWPGNVLWIKY